MVFLEFINFDIVNVDEGNKNDGTIVEVLLYFELYYIWGPTWQAVAHFQGTLRLCADFPQVWSRSWRLLCFRALEVIAWWQTELNMFEVPAGMSWRTAKITKLNKQTGPGPKPTFQRACVTYQLVLGSSMGILVLRNVTELGRHSVIHWGYSEGMLNYRKHMWHAVKIWGGETKPPAGFLGVCLPGVQKCRPGMLCTSQCDVLSAWCRPVSTLHAGRGCPGWRSAGEGNPKLHDTVHLLFAMCHRGCCSVFSMRHPGCEMPTSSPSRNPSGHILGRNWAWRKKVRLSLILREKEFKHRSALNKCFLGYGSL